MTPLAARAASPAIAVTLAAAAVGWFVSLQQMDGMDMGAATELRSLGFFAVSWMAMTAAMMLPGASAAVARRRLHVGAASRFLLAYIAVWSVVGLGLYALYEPHGSTAAAVVVFAASVYELTPIKRRLRRRCGESHGSGWEFGACCVGSSIGLMLVLAALGIMSVAWMAVVAAVVSVQKLLPPRAAVDVPLAVALAALGALIVLAPASFAGSTPPM